MLTMTNKLGATIAAIAVITSASVMQLQKTDPPVNSSVVVVRGSSGYNKGLAVPTPRILGAPVSLAIDPDRLSPENSDMPTNNDTVNQLHQSIDSEDKDIRWAGDVQREVSSILSDVPFLSGERRLNCGTIRCEVSLNVQSGITHDNMDTVLQKLSVLPESGHDYPFIIEGVFPVSVDGSPGSGVRVIYMRH